MRARSAADASSSAIAIHVAVSSRPAASRRPRQSSSGAIPAQPIATSHCPWRQARPNESVITTAGATPRRRLSPARIRRAEASGSTRKQDQRVRGGRVGCVHTGVGAHEPVPGDADQDAARCAQDLFGLVEHDLHVSWVLAVARGQLDRARARLDVRQRPCASLGLGDDLVGDHDHVVAGDGSRRAAPTPAIRAARSSPGCTSGMPSTATRRAGIVMPCCAPAG